MTSNLEDAPDQLSPQAIAALMYAHTSEAPPTTVDIGYAVVEGLRERRRRRIMPAVSAVVVLAVVIGIGANTLLRATPTGVDTGALPSAGAEAPERFNPLRARLEVGWLPDGVSPTEPTYASGAQTQRWWDGNGSPGSPLGRWVDVTIYAGAVQPPLFTLGETSQQPADETQLSSAVWISGLAPEVTTLAWRWAPNAWAFVQASESPQVAADRSLVAHVAQTVTADREQAVRVPFVVARPPSGLTLSKVQFIGGIGDSFYAGLEFGTGQTPLDLGTAHPHDEVIVYVSWHPAGYISKEVLNRTIDGRPASVQFSSPDWGTVTLFPQSRMEAGIVAQGTAARALIDESTAIALARSITVVGDASTRSGWTATPLAT